MLRVALLLIVGVGGALLVFGVSPLPVAVGALLALAVSALIPTEAAPAQLPAPKDPGERDKEARELRVLRAVVEGMSDAVWITDADGVVVQHNAALKELLFTGTELNGKQPIELIRSAELAEAVGRACKENLPSMLEVEIQGIRPRTLSVHVSALGRELGGSAAVFFDETELRHLETVRKDFVANVSHELRTPITAIRGYAETLQSGALSQPDTASKMIDIIHRQSERLSALVEDLLEISRLESKELALASAPVEVNRAAQRAIETVRPKAEARRISIFTRLPVPLTVKGDERGVEQVLLNLLDNAVKYTPPGGEVTLAGKALEDGVELWVKDTGVGIEPKHQPRIFERFYRVDKGRSREMGGTGLGLSIVKHLVNAMGGEVRVESTPGSGSTFFVTLPGPAELAP
ncbi:MAG: ATP-binding protein [Myxococcaceae bacterium]